MDIDKNNQYELAACAIIDIINKLINENPINSDSALSYIVLSASIKENIEIIEKTSYGILINDKFT